MIRVERLTFSYPNAPRPVLDSVNFAIEPGELVLTIGPSGGGKSTLLRCLNGLVPHFHGGSFAGRVVVGGRDTHEHQPRDLADAVGLVMQDPESQMVTETVEDEIAFGIENLELPRTAVRKRVEEVLDLLRLAPLRSRRLETLSGGELQRVAIAAVLSMQPSVLLLDEPTSQLDPQAAEELLTTVQRLNDDLGIAVVIAEHRLERVVQHADRVLYVPGDGSVKALGVREAMEALDGMAPPVTRLGRSLGWTPLPLSVREGRRFAGDLRLNGRGADGMPSSGETAVIVNKLCVSYDGASVLRDVAFQAHRGEIVALMGRNGAGKTTLLRAIVRLAQAESGSVAVLGRNTSGVPTEALAREVALVPQEPASVLYHDSVEAEIVDTLRGTGREGTVEEALAEWELEPFRTSHPLDLSAGERQRAALAAMLAGEPRLILLDEPTRGMDYATKELLVANLRRRCAAGAAVVLASHDVELAAACADRVLLLAEGRVVVDAPVHKVLSETLTFSTQINKLLGGDLLTPEDALAAIERGPAA